MNWWPFRKRTVASAASQVPTYPSYLDRMASTAAYLEHQHLLLASTAASQLARHGAARRRNAAREKIVEKAKAEARRMNRPDLLERLSR